MTRLIRRVGATNDWVRREPSAHASARLFCLPYSGCGATMYRRWPGFIGTVEVVPVQLPGRESRFREPHYGTVEQLAGQLMDALAGYFDRPFAFFGHCGSALPAYEVSVRLHERGGPMPANVFVSSQVAPHQGPYGRFLELPDEELMVEMHKLAAAMGGELLDDLADVYLEILRADIEANKRYRRDAVWLPHPITAIGWDQDTEVEHHLMAGWADCGPTRFAVLPGPHHSFLHAPPRLLSLIEDGLGSRTGMGAT
jgi:surfactin synthase thioesterase subunit